MKRSLLLLLPGLFGLGPLQAAPVTTDPESGISIDVTPVFDPPPPNGPAPFRVEIENASDRDGEWNFAWVSNPWQNQTFRSTETFRVERGQKRVFQIVVPQISSQGSIGPVQLRAKGSGIPTVAENHFAASGSGSYRGSGSSDTPVLAFSPDVAARSWEPLKDLAKKSTPSGGKKEATGIAPFTLHSSGFRLENLPDQWSGYLGIEWLFLSEPEWNRLAAPVRNALRQWVGAGGRLVVLSTRPEAVAWPGFPHSNAGLTGSGPFSYGLGTCRAIGWEGREIAPEELLALVGKKTLLSLRENAEKPGWPTLKGMDSIRPPKAFVIGATLLLAVTMGPLNLFVFAPRQRRYRLFWTTPLLALGGSFLLGASIFLIDGTGGKGGRTTLLQLLPGAPEAVLLQTQAARTGLLLSRSFPVEAETVLSPVSLNGATDSHREYRLDGGTASGAWFESRSLQRMDVTTLRPTRAGITFFPEGSAGEAAVISRFEAPLAELYVQSGGHCWKAETVRTGERTALRAIPKAEFDKAWKEAGSHFPAVARFYEPSMGHHAFFTRLADPTGIPVATLPSIRWEDDRVYATGPVEIAQGGTR